MGKGHMYATFWWENLSGRAHLKDLGADGRIILQRIFKNQDGNATELICLRTDTWCSLVKAVMNIPVQ
jgi:hypothetical protein